MLLDYFGEKARRRCGVCDFCRELNKIDLNQVEMDNFRNRVFQILEQGPATIGELLENTGIQKQEKALEMIGWMVDQQLLKYNTTGRIMKIKKSGTPDAS